MLPQIKQTIKRYPYLARVAGFLQREVDTTLSHFPLRGPIPNFNNLCKLSINTYSSMQEYALSPAVIAAQTSYEISLLPEGQKSFAVPGYCSICERDTVFECDFAYCRNLNGRSLPNWRESLVCRGCGFRNRIRGALHVLLQEYRPHDESSIYITEQLTRVYRWIKGRYPNTIGSEYIESSTRPGDVRRGIRHEDVQLLSFYDESFDTVLSFDVLEHVPDANQAFREFWRVLRPGGRLFFTAPMDFSRSETLIRALLDQRGEIVHLEQPEYHGNPSDPAHGSLCFRHFGWSVLDDLRDIGFSQPKVHTWWDEKMGYLQYPQYAITAIRA